ncbi:nucleotide exchange factor GrpE [Desulfopila sp. IMCC35008]|uniref:nucleotide exchange factor GrpE n=1 Tax=Desulfopila sp. IMCC35008 TaxID=2653858 RepID=UPI0013D214AE|nr:nucleotide exchange factor GrpE [Desulfopila sp. IMCC35008]
MSKEKKNNDLEDEKTTIEESVDSEATVESPSESVAEEVQEEAQTPEDELEAARKEVAELRDQLLRTVAESENFKKRMERERMTALKYSGEQIFREILPAVDNLERAIGQGVVEGASAEKNLAGLLEGVQLTLKSLNLTLEKFEVKPVEAVGKPFDPNHQEALTMEPSDTIPANSVVTEFEKGYYYKDRLLRAAKVVVSSGKPE